MMAGIMARARAGSGTSAGPRPASHTARHQPAATTAAPAAAAADPPAPHSLPPLVPESRLAPFAGLRDIVTAGGCHGTDGIRVTRQVGRGFLSVGLAGAGLVFFYLPAVACCGVVRPVPRCLACPMMLPGCVLRMRASGS